MLPPKQLSTNKYPAPSLLGKITEQVSYVGPQRIPSGVKLQLPPVVAELLWHLLTALHSLCHVSLQDWRFLEVFLK